MNLSLYTSPLPANLRASRAEACEVPESVIFDGEIFRFIGHTCYEDNRGNAEFSYFWVSSTGRVAVDGGFRWSVTA